MCNMCEDFGKIKTQDNMVVDDFQLALTTYREQDGSPMKLTASYMNDNTVVSIGFPASYCPRCGKKLVE